MYLNLLLYNYWIIPILLDRILWWYVEIEIIGLIWFIRNYWPKFFLFILKEMDLFDSFILHSSIIFDDNRTLLYTFAIFSFLLAKFAFNVGLMVVRVATVLHSGTAATMRQSAATASRQNTSMLIIFLKLLFFFLNCPFCRIHRPAEPWIASSLNMTPHDELFLRRRMRSCVLNNLKITQAGGAAWVTMDRRSVWLRKLYCFRHAQNGAQMRINYSKFRWFMSLSDPWEWWLRWSLIGFSR